MFTLGEGDYWQDFEDYGYLALIHPVLALIIVGKTPEFFQVLSIPPILCKLIWWGLILYESDGYFICYYIVNYYKKSPQFFVIYLICACIRRLLFYYKNYLKTKVIYQDGYINGARESIHMIHVNDFQLLDYNPKQLSDRYNKTQLSFIRKKVNEFLSTLATVLGSNHSHANNEKLASDVIANGKSCCICFCDDADIIFNPCRHLAMCHECFEKYSHQAYDQDKDLKCLLCNTLVASIDCYKKRRFVHNHVEPEEFYQSGQNFTQKELVKLGAHVEKNPQLKRRLQNPNIFD